MMDKIMKFAVFAILLSNTLVDGTAIPCSAVIPATLIPLTFPFATQVEEGDIKFYLYTRNNPQGIELFPGTYQQVDKQFPVKIIIHGWSENVNTQWLQNITREYLKKGEYNIIRVDYDKIATAPYFISASNAETVGQYIGKLIVNLSTNYGIPLNQTHIIGHSLGGQVSAAAGREVISSINQKIYRITALDAAGPLYECPPLLAKQALKKSDAEIVDAIHTDIILFGYKGNFSDADFYPNGGNSPEPGCPSLLRSLITSVFNIKQGLEDILCSHHRSFKYFISSINTGKFVGTKCNSWNNYTSDGCDNNPTSLMGDRFERLSDDDIGKFYLRTTANDPYAEETY